MVSLFTKFLMVACGLYLVALLALYFGQRRLIYVPNPERVLPEAVGLVGFDEIVLKPAPDVDVLAWYSAVKSGVPTYSLFSRQCRQSGRAGGSA